MERHDRSGSIGGTGQIARIRAVDTDRGEALGHLSRLFFSEFVQRSRKVRLEDAGIVFNRSSVAGEDDFHSSEGLVEHFGIDRHVLVIFS